MGKRAEQMEDTRQRITEAAMRLHTSIGPSQTTIAGIAEEAGVTRVTVYRHFEDEEELFLACSGHWFSLHPPPDPSSWESIEDLGDRWQAALTEVYRFYRGGHEDLYPIYRDIAFTPPRFGASMSRDQEALVESLVRGSGLRGRRRARMRAIAGHVLSFWVWRSLAVEQGLDDETAVEIGLCLLECF